MKAVALTFIFLLSCTPQGHGCDGSKEAFVLECEEKCLKLCFYATLTSDPCLCETDTVLADCVLMSVGE